MKKSIQLIYSAIIILITSLVVGVIINDFKIWAIIFFLALIIEAYRIYKDKIGQELIIAFLFALIITSYYIYEYTTQNITLGRINLFPLISWTLLLIISRELYENLKKPKFAKICITYWAILFAVEYLGYYLLNIQLNSNYPSLLNLGIIHAPIGMKLFYLLAGPIYILITDYLHVK